MEKAPQKIQFSINFGLITGLGYVFTDDSVQKALNITTLCTPDLCTTQRSKCIHR
jgi:hypothetical protein